MLVWLKKNVSRKWESKKGKKKRKFGTIRELWKGLSREEKKKKYRMVQTSDSSGQLLGVVLWIEISNFGGKRKVVESLAVRKMSKGWVLEKTRDYWVLSILERRQTSIRMDWQCIWSQTGLTHPFLQTVALLWRDNLLRFRQEIKAWSLCTCLWCTAK